MTGQFHLLSRHFPHSKLSPLWLFHSQEKSFCSYCSQLTLLLLLISCLWEKKKKKNSLRFINQFLLVVKINFVDYWLHLLLLQFVGTWHFFSLNHISTKNSNDAVHILKPQSTEVWPWLNCYPLFDKAPVLIKVVSWFSLLFCICILDILSKLSWSSAFCSLISLWF